MRDFSLVDTGVSSKGPSPCSSPALPADGMGAAASGGLRGPALGKAVVAELTQHPSHMGEALFQEPTPHSPRLLGMNSAGAP